MKKGFFFFIFKVVFTVRAMPKVIFSHGESGVFGSCIFDHRF